MNELRAFLVHGALFALLTVLVSIVYHGLRRESVREILSIGVRKSVYYVLAAFVFGVGAHFLTLWL